MSQTFVATSDDSLYRGAVHCTPAVHQPRRPQPPCPTPVLVAGFKHRGTPLGIFERMTLSAAEIPKALRRLASSAHMTEVAILATCNRTEVYAVSGNFHGAISDINRFFMELSGLGHEEFTDHLFSAYNETAVHHLFNVTAGLDSAVVGETEILGQVRMAFKAAAHGGVTGPHLSTLFRHALETGKRARAETSISRGTASVSHAAVELATNRIGSLSGRTVLVLGTGEIGVSMVHALQRARVGEVLVANRTPQKAAQLAQQVGGRAVPIHELPTALQSVDVLLTATSSDSVVLTRNDVELVMASRHGRQLLIVDTAMPRDVDPSASRVAGVTLLDLGAIQEFVERGLDSRRSEIQGVQAIVAQECDRYTACATARLVAPLIASMHSKAERTRADECARFESRLADLSPEQHQAVEALTRQLVAKLLHTPTVRLKEHAGTVRGNRMADGAHALFHLDETPRLA